MKRSRKIRRAAKKVAERKDLPAWLEKQTAILEKLSCTDCPDEYWTNERGGPMIDFFKTDYSHRFVVYYVARLLKRFGIEPGYEIPNDWKVASEALAQYGEGCDDFNDEEAEIYDGLEEDFSRTALPVETYGDFGAEVYTVDLSDLEETESDSESEKYIRAEYRKGIKGMPRGERSQLFRDHLISPEEILSFGMKKIYFVRFPFISRDLSFSWALGGNIVERLWNIAKFPIMITNCHHVITVSGADYVVTAASDPNENEPYRQMEYAENMFNYVGLLAMFYLEVVHCYLEERRKENGI